MTTKKQFKILALDGGGCWALIQVMALQELFGSDTKGHDVLQEFDLICANSGGSIVLAGLIENLTLSSILEFFTSQKKRDTIFVKRGGCLHNLLKKRLPVFARYSAQKKLIGLQNALPRFGNKTLDELVGKMNDKMDWPKLIICTFDCDANRAVFFRSDVGSLAAGAKTNWQPTVAEAIHASSNAPIFYFDEPAVFPDNKNASGKRYWDGGIGGFNNPVLAATCESLANAKRYGCDAVSIKALSIGTGIVKIPLDEKNKPFVPL